MNNALLQFAAEVPEVGTGTEAGLFGALGIDVRTLLLQIIAFGVLVWFLGKYVYPPLTRAIDSREEKIAESVAAASEAEARAEKSQKETEKLLKQARVEADEILARSHAEAASQVSEAEEKAKARAEQIVKDAHIQLQADVAKARLALKKDTAELVAMATERIIHEKVDSKKDVELVERALSGKHA